MNKIKVLSCTFFISLNKKLSNFLNAYQYDRIITNFGNNFTYNKDDYYFSKEDEKLIDFLLIHRQIDRNSSIRGNTILKLINKVPTKEITITTEQLFF